jgi:hypothetical protein
MDLAPDDHGNAVPVGHQTPWIPWFCTERTLPCLSPRLRALTCMSRTVIRTLRGICPLPPPSVVQSVCDTFGVTTRLTWDA